MPLTLTLPDLLTRCKSADTHPVDYLLGGGQSSARAAHPWKPFRVGDHLYPRGCDCSAFACWAVGVDKYDRALKLWFGTDNLYADAIGPKRRFRQIDTPVVGCLVVYPGYQKHGKRRSGHVGVVLDPAKHRVIDCADSPDDDRPGVGDAITQRVAEFFWDPKPAFRKPAIFVWALNVAV